MKACLASELRTMPDGTIYTVHNNSNGYLLPIGGFRIKKSAHLAREASYRPNWYMAYLTLNANAISGHRFALKATEVLIDPTLNPGSTVFVWEDTDIKELQRLLRGAMATSDNPDLSPLDETYDFTCPGLLLNTKTGRGEYNKHPFKLSSMQVKLILALSAGTTQPISLDALAQSVGPDSQNPTQAVKQLLNRTLKAMGSKLGDALCPVLEFPGRFGGFKWVGNTPRY